MTGCRIKSALASDDAITAAIERWYGAEMDGQEELDIALEDLAAPAKAEPPPKVETPPRVVSTPAAPVPDMSASALKELEGRYENLIRILLDKGVIDNKDLDELM
jgi:hypothetical protein